jgi:hypothetical protein
VTLLDDIPEKKLAASGLQELKLPQNKNGAGMGFCNGAKGFSFGKHRGRPVRPGFL